ncbi:hypothetical protein OENI_140020 [Oenococcus oeni]|nr:hypothetical protein OENI_140020 [Oenococcus oeni]
MYTNNWYFACQLFRNSKKRLILKKRLKTGLFTEKLQIDPPYKLQIIYFEYQIKS